MHENAKLLETFYGCFRDRDHRGMAACYHDQIAFDDPVFLRLTGKRAKAMWHMLVSRSPDTRIQFSNVFADASSGSAAWQADYFFGEKRRPVHNEIASHFRFAGGKIIEHRDHFPLWKWSSMALGLSGTLLGWSPIVQNKIRAMAKGQLDKFIQQNTEYAGT